MAARKERVMNRKVEQNPKAVVSDCCSRIPVSHLGLDVAEPIAGWPAFFRERNIEVAPDDVGRPSVPRHVLGELLAERREQEARVAQRAEQAAARKTPIPAGVPAVEGASPFESLVAAGGVVTPAQEFGGGRRPVFQELLDQELAAGARQVAAKRAEAEAVKKAKRALDGRDG